MDCSITSVVSDSDIAVVAELADRIWNEHFIPIIGEQQVEYMLGKFQSVPAITSQLQSGFEYYIAATGGKPVGYTGLVPERAADKMMISKLYVQRDARGSGIGGRILQFVEQECYKRGIATVWLTVNRFNLEPIEWYRHKGFSIADEVRKDIGGGFFMDDYIMEKQL